MLRKPLLILALMFTVAAGATVPLAYAEGTQGNNEVNWNSPQDPTIYWGNASKNITTDDDQRSLDASSPSIPGLEVIPARIFAAHPPMYQATNATSAGSGNLVDHNGSVFATTKIYAVFWGPLSSSFSTPYQSSTVSFLRGLACSSTSLPSCSGMSSMVKNQYLRGAPLNLSYVKQYSDLTNPPSTAPTTTAIANEVVKVVTANHDSLDPNGLYLVFTSNFPSRANYCAWHSAASAKVSNVNTSFTFGYMPNLATAISGCGANYLPNYHPSGLGSSLDSLFNVTTHEMYETITDPSTSGNAWYDAAGYEIGDKCAWNWSTQISSGGISFTVQQEYSNTAKACASS